MLSVVLDAEQLEVELAAGRVLCPDCGSPLSRWGFARARVVRLRGQVRSHTPRRACCRGCARTHVLCPSWMVPGRLDGAEVIGEALGLAVYGGLGHRPIALRLDRPPATVRGWLRAARAHAQGLRECATRWVACLDPEPAAITAAASQLGDAVEAVMLAVRAWVLRFGRDLIGPWERAVWLTGGLLAAGRTPP